MSSVVISGDTSGTVTVTVPAVAGTNTVTIPAVTGTAVVSGQNSAITAGTAVASTSGTSISFTGIPSWVKRITVMFNAVSTSGTSQQIIQIGSGSYANTGYASGAFSPNTSNLNSSVGFVLMASNATAGNYSGSIQLSLLNSSTNIWVSSGVLGEGVSAASNGGAHTSGGTKTLSGALDRVQVTTINGTDTFDAGSINILYE